MAKPNTRPIILIVAPAAIPIFAVMLTDSPASLTVFTDSVSIAFLGVT
jgi:hypothetical protein